VKLLTLGDGKVDKDAVLQAGKAQVDRLKAASQEIVFEILDIVGSGVGGGIEPSGLGLAQEIVDQADELAGGGGNFGDHENSAKGKGPPRGCAWGRVREEKVVLDFQWRFPHGGRSSFRKQACWEDGSIRMGCCGRR
jgi:hypothetical protein